MSRFTAIAALSLTLLLPVPPCAAAAVAQERGMPAERVDVVAPDPAHVAFDPAAFAGLEYRPIGPSRGGRVTAVAGHPSLRGTFLMGATGGGVWRTEDYGITWRNLSDGWFRTPSIGAVRMAPTNPDVVYVGTGSDGLRSNVITGLGVYGSRDGGATWRFLGLEDAGLIGAVEVHPDDEDVVFVAAIGHPFGRNAQRGVFKTTDGGQTWRKVLFLADSIGFSDVELHPTDPSTVYAGAWRGERKPWTIISGARDVGGIWKSGDGGETWRRVAEGLPTGLIGKTDLAVSAADPDRVYALIEAPEPAEGLYRSDDAGETWRQVSSHGPLMDRPFYYTNVDADPTDADVVYVSATRFWKSVDGGVTWESRPTPHIDHHDLWIDPTDPKVMIQGNDGGATVTLDGGESWSTQLNQPTAELYQVALDDRFPRFACAGQQDNSTICVPTLPPTQTPPDHPAAEWAAVGGCETGPAVPKPGDWRTLFSNCKGRFGVYSHDTGQERQYWVGGQYMYGHNPAELKYRFQRVSPIEVSPHDPGTVYHASQHLHRTRDGGLTWETISPDLTANPKHGRVVSGYPITRDVTGEEFFSTIYAVEESPLSPGLIWVGTNDGLVQLTRDAGATWHDVTPPALPADARIQTVEPSPHDPAKAYVAAYRYLLDDWRPFIFRTADHGRTWTLLTTGDNGVPDDYPTRVIREDPLRPGLLFAGTEWGMFVSFDDGARWQPLQRGLPVVPITDIQLRDDDLVLSTMGRGFWVLDGLAPLRQLTPEVTASAVHLFQPDRAVRMRYWTFAGGPSDPVYPPPGAFIDYWLGEDATDLRLEVLDADGRVLRAFSSDGPGEAVGWEQALRGPVRVSVGTPALETGRGMHRVLWDLALPGPWDARPDRTGRSGPLAVPGSYRLRLTADGVTTSRPLEILIDPRLPPSGTTVADLQAQLDLNLRIRDLLSEARIAAARATEGPPGAAAERLRAALVTSTLGSYPQPMLVDQIEYLYDMTTSADQRPGRDAYERYQQLREELDELVADR